MRRVAPSTMVREQIGRLLTRRTCGQIGGGDAVVAGIEVKSHG